MKLNKNRLANRTKVEEADDYQSHLAANGEIKVEASKSPVAFLLTLGGRSFTALAKLVLVAIGLLAVLYMLIASTLMFSAPTGDGPFDRYWVARGTFVGGEPPKDTIVYGSAVTAVSGNDEASTSAFGGFLDRTWEGIAGVPAPVVVKILAGPYGELTTKGGEIAHNGTKTGYKGQLNDKIFLNKSYLALCVDGTCKPGDLLVIKQDNIAGEIQGTISLDGIQQNNNTLEGK